MTTRPLANIPITITEVFLRTAWRPAFLALSFLFLAAAANVGADITVPDDYETIQEAIDAAAPDETIIVKPDVYQENISTNGKDIVLRSTDPSDPSVVASTILEPAPDTVKPILTFENSETPDCLVSGLTFRNGYVSELGGWDGYGGAINGGTRSQQPGGGAQATIDRCVFTSNTADYDTRGEGGAIYGFDGEIRDCVFLWNNGGRAGGAICYSNATITGCWFEGNSARDGGAIESCNGSIQGNIFVGNRATMGYGGAIMSSGSRLTSRIYHNVAYDNHAGLRGGGFSNSGMVKNCIVWGNTADYGTDLDDQIYETDFPEYCCIQSYDSANWGNISEDPEFVDAASGDFHLEPNSPCVDAGAAFEDALSLDIDGDSRGIDAVDEERGDGSNIDIGVDELCGVTVANLRDYILGRLSIGATTLRRAGVQTNDGVDGNDLVERVNAAR